MTTEAIRSAVVTAVEAAKATFAPGYTLIIEYDNRILIDTQTQTNPYLCVDIRLIAGEQADIADNPIHRIYGSIALIACIKEGAGRKLANDILDHFYPKLQRKTLGGVVRTRMASFEREFSKQGWAYYIAVIPFWSDQTS
jgi:hypothetical protein